MRAFHKFQHQKKQQDKMAATSNKRTIHYREGKERAISPLKITRLNPRKPKAVIRQSHYSFTFECCVCVCEWEKERGHESTHAHRQMLRATRWELCRWVIKVRTVCIGVFLPLQCTHSPLCHIWEKLHLSLVTLHMHRRHTHAVWTSHWEEWRSEPSQHLAKGHKEAGTRCTHPEEESENRQLQASRTKKKRSYWIIKIGFLTDIMLRETFYLPVR